MTSANDRLRNAMAKAGCLYGIPDELIDEASKKYDIDIKIALFEQWVEDKKEFEKRAIEELGDEWNPSWDWRHMPTEKAIEILEK